MIRRLFNEYKSSRARSNSFPDLTFEINPLITIRKISSDFKLIWFIHYLILTLINLFVLIILPLSIIQKLIFTFVCLLILTIPLTSQFFLNGLPVLTWVFLFFSSSKIPVDWKPPITVQVLPAMETILFGDNLSQLLASFTLPFLDILSWIPYGIIHYSFPFVVASLIWIFAPPKTLQSYGFAFGYMNLIGVIIQNIFPAAPPWYKILHGLEKANYSMNGSPGGLGRIDKLFGIDLYTTSFTNSPLIFGAFPSLHSGCATMDALWLWYLFPKFSPIWIIYVCWLWWSTMYLTHHYFMDLVMGSILAITFFYFVKLSGLQPLIENDKFCRWSYDDMIKWDYWHDDPLLLNYEDEFDDFNNNNNDDEIFDQFIIDNDEDPLTGESYELQDTSTPSFNDNDNQFIRKD